MVSKELEKAWTTFAKTVDGAHKDWLKTVQKYRGEAGKGSGFRDSEGRDAVVSAMEWYLEKVFMADRRFGGIDYKKYRTLLGESVEEAKMPEPRKDEYFFLVRNNDAKDVWKMADDEFGNDIDRGRIEVLFQKNKYVIKDFELAKRFYQYLRDRGVKFFDQNFVSESVEVDEAIELFSLYNPIEFAQEWSAAYGEDLQQEYGELYKELLKLKQFTVLDIVRLWKKLYGEDFKKEHSALYKKLDK